jgi:hypothetical protein
MSRMLILKEKHDGRGDGDRHGVGYFGVIGRWCRPVGERGADDTIEASEFHID